VEQKQFVKTLNGLAGNQKSGFTLAELLVVTVIVGILGILSIPKFYAQIEKAKISQALGVLSAIQKNEKIYRAEHGYYKALYEIASTADWGGIGMMDPSPFLLSSPDGEFKYEFRFLMDSYGYFAFATRTTKNDYKGYSGKRIRVRHSDGKAVCSADQSDHPLIPFSACW